MAQDRMVLPEQAPISGQTLHQNFILAGIEDTPSGGKQITFYIPQTGKLESWPMPQEMAKKVGQKLLAPSVSVTDKIPPQAKAALRNGNGG